MKQKINIYMFRHGLSKTQTLQMKKGLLGKILHLFVKDPCLENEGIRNSMQSGKKICDLMTHHKPCSTTFENYVNLDENSVPTNFDYVFSSTLLRAIETSCCMFQQKKIYVVPYISEIMGGLNIIPDEPRVQMQKINAKFPNANVDWSYVSSRNVLLPDYEKFIDFLKKFLVDKKVNSALPVNIAVVSHSLFMMKNIMAKHKKPWFWRFLKKPNNNEAIVYTIEI